MPNSKSHVTRKVTAQNVRQGDFLTDLDNGYVVEDPVPADENLTWWRSGAMLGHDLVLITFHDANGDENHLILQSDHPIRVHR